jgi:hypothetical protein
MGFIYAAIWFPVTVFVLTEYVFNSNAGIEAFLFTLTITSPAVIISMPIFYLIQRHKPIQFLDCALAGISIPILALVGYIGLETPFSLALLCVGIGLISSTVFWVVGVRQKTRTSFYH